MEASRPLAGGGAELRNVSAVDAQHIQQVANRYQVVIHLVGSRAAGASGRTSDFDYVIAASHRVRNSAKYLLPRGPRTGQGAGIDIFAGPLDALRPHVSFMPRQERTEVKRGE